MIAEKQIEGLLSRVVTTLQAWWKGEATVVSTLTSERDLARNELKAAQEKIAAHDSTIATLTGQRDQAWTDLTAAKVEIAKLEDGKKSVAEEAASIASAAGHTPLPIKPDASSAPKTRDSVQAEYDRLVNAGDHRGAARFYAENKKLLS